jgi:hypothetical protein
MPVSTDSTVMPLTFQKIAIIFGVSLLISGLFFILPNMYFRMIDADCRMFCFTGFSEIIFSPVIKVIGGGILAFIIWRMKVPNRLFIIFTITILYTLTAILFDVDNQTIHSYLVPFIILPMVTGLTLFSFSRKLRYSIPISVISAVILIVLVWGTSQLIGIARTQYTKMQVERMEVIRDLDQFVAYYQPDETKRVVLKKDTHYDFIHYSSFYPFEKVRLYEPPASRRISEPCVGARYMLYDKTWNVFWISVPSFCVDKSERELNIYYGPYRYPSTVTIPTPTPFQKET